MLGSGYRGQGLVTQAEPLEGCPAGPDGVPSLLSRTPLSRALFSGSLPHPHQIPHLPWAVTVCPIVPAAEGTRGPGEQSPLHPPPPHN